MAKKSRDKGKVGEREVAALLRGHGFTDARRGVQYQGGHDSDDVVGLPGVHVEVKRTESFRLYPALEQAKSESKAGDIPTVFHRSNGRLWVVVMDACDFLTLIRSVTDAKAIMRSQGDRECLASLGENCGARSAQYGSDPIGRQMAYIIGILRNRCGGTPRVFHADLRGWHEKGISIDYMTERAKVAWSWSEFIRWMDEAAPRG